jgi:hypothetical protein
VGNVNGAGADDPIVTVTVSFPLTSTTPGSDRPVTVPLIVYAAAGGGFEFLLPPPPPQAVSAESAHAATGMLQTRYK